MKLDPEFLMQDVGGEAILVPTGSAAEKLHGIVQLNETAAFIAEMLRRETTPEAIVLALDKEYEGTREQFTQAVNETLSRLREAGAIVE